ncbi:LAETG motif-containing sortase-dependent surface protein [Allostreptomyces psammosilenae]|uniref:Gram-positive cocci surface proteins LPxTG domain-containing protein n=1 Tax=Allostreptomyces psammosilenae TaxID=1892865 RepID=A0A852ZU29_9ACTN|nr:LAETG motif-containing sortase-dependent surface protein [Allostreptomyces psammosilenae]NYI05819.1 hypothetical protein [Allostreptomyces psammosilenae]
MSLARTTKARRTAATATAIAAFAAAQVIGFAGVATAAEGTTPDNAAVAPGAAAPQTEDGTETTEETEETTSEENTEETSEEDTSEEGTEDDAASETEDGATEGLEGALESLDEGASEEEWELTPEDEALLNWLAGLLGKTPEELTDADYETITEVFFHEEAWAFDANTQELFSIDAETGAIDGGIEFSVNNPTQFDVSDVTVTLTTIDNLTFGEPGTPSLGGTVNSASADEITLSYADFAAGALSEVNIPATLGDVDADALFNVDITVAVPGVSEPLTLAYYDFTITSEVEEEEEETASPTPSESPAGSAGGNDPGPQLAETGGSSMTPTLIGVAGALVVLGGGMAFYATKRRSANNTAA